MGILIGAASWADKGLTACGRFYPRGVLGAEAWLRYYASQFPIVEVDSSYYAMPSVQNAQLWAERTPDHFVMNVKAFRLLTGHHADPSVLPADIRDTLGERRGRLYYRQLPSEIRDELWRRFDAALEPLQTAGKLGAVLFQFAPWLVNNREGRMHVERCAERMGGYRIAIEFRHPSWFQGAHRNATLAFERSLGATHVVADSPQGLDNSVPLVWEQTNDALAVVRLHGRNADSWSPQGIAPRTGRFNYEYGDDELAGIADHIRTLARAVAEVHVVFNTNHDDQGPRNARKLMRLMQIG